MNIDSLRELAVLDGERLQALWDEIGRLSAPQAPIAKIVVDENDGLMTMLYAPGLPPGEHDLYCAPWAPHEYWRPIDTAPKDGTPVIGYCTSEFYEGRASRIIVAHYAGPYHEWVVPGVGGLKLSHWMPLPALPRNSGAK